MLFDKVALKTEDRHRLKFISGRRKI